MSGTELNLLCASMLKSKCVPICGNWKSSMYGKDRWIVVYARVCTILSGKHHRHRIMSRYGTAKTTINRFSLTRLSHG